MSDYRKIFIRQLRAQYPPEVAHRWHRSSKHPKLKGYEWILKELRRTIWCVSSAQTEGCGRRTTWRLFASNCYQTSTSCRDFLCASGCAMQGHYLSAAEMLRETLRHSVESGITSSLVLLHQRVGSGIGLEGDDASMQAACAYGESLTTSAHSRR